MAYVSLGHAIRNILLREEKEQNVNPAKKKGPPGGDWEEASEEDRKSKSKEIVKSVKTPGQKEVKEQLRLNPNQKSKVLTPSHEFSGNQFITPPVHIKPPGDTRSHENDHAQRTTNKTVQIKNKIGSKTHNIAEKEIKEISDLGGVTSSQSNPEPEDGGKKKIKEQWDDDAYDVIANHKKSEAGYSVRGTVRAKNHEDAMKQWHGMLQSRHMRHKDDPAGDEFSYAVTHNNSGKKQTFNEAFGDAGLTSFKDEDGGKKKVKKESAFDTAGGDTPIGSMGGKSNPGPSARMNTEDGGKKKIKEEAEGTKDRKTIENVARQNSATSPFDRKSKLAKNAEIKTKIIDEGKKRANTIKKIVKGDKGSSPSEDSGNGPTKVIGDVVWNPNLQKPDKDTVSN